MFGTTAAAQHRQLEDQQIRYVLSMFTAGVRVREEEERERFVCILESSAEG